VRVDCAAAETAAPWPLPAFVLVSVPVAFAATCVTAVGEACVEGCGLAANAAPASESAETSAAASASFRCELICLMGSSDFVSSGWDNDAVLLALSEVAQSKPTADAPHEPG
jgi:hypothetical protein